MSLESVSDFAELVATMPDQIDLTSCCEPPPILACGDRSIATAALNMLEAETPGVRALYKHLMKMEKERSYHQYLFVTKMEVSELTKACALLEHFTGRISDVLDVTLGNRKHRVGMLEFLEAAHFRLSTICQQCRHWVQSAAQTVDSTPSTVPGNTVEGDDKSDGVDGADMGDGVEGNGTCSGLLKELLISVQRVMIRHRECFAITEENKDDLLDFPCCMRLHLTAINNLTDMNAEKVIEQLESILQAIVKNPTEGVVKEVLPVLPLLHHYTTLLRMVVLDLTLAHRTLSKLLSILLALFTDLVTKGVCIPPEVDIERHSGIGEAEGGGIDEGQGAKNISSEVDAEDLEDPTEKSGEREDTSDREREEVEEEGGEEAVDMTQEFEGDVKDLPEKEEEEEGSGGEEEEDYDKEMGKLGKENQEQIDWNMWAPEQDQQQEELKDSEDQGSGNSEKDETILVAKEENGKQSQSDNSEPPHQTTGEEVDDSTEKEQDIGPHNNNAENSNPAELEQEQEQECDDPGFDMDNLNLSEGEDDDHMSSDDKEHDQSSGVEQEEGEEIGDGEVDQTENPSAEEELNEEDEVTTGQSVEPNSLCGAEVVSSDDHLPPNSSTQQKAQENMEVGLENEVTTEPSEHETENGSSTVFATTTEHNQDEHQWHQKLHPRPEEDYSLAGQQERALKRPRLMQDRTEEGHSPPSTHNSEQALMSQMFQHMREEGGDAHDAVVWGAAPLSHAIPGSLPSILNTDTEEPEEAGRDNTNTTEDRQNDKHLQQAGTADSDLIGPEPMETEPERENISRIRAEAAPQPDPHSFFGSTNLHILQGNSRNVDEERLRQTLKDEIRVLHSMDKDVDVYGIWQKYEALMSALSYSLCEELRLVLQPTQAAQLRGDYHTGKRLNMRRIIPYIASYFQNDRIWLRRVKPSKRDYQVLVAVDDSASMNENECSQMAYESLAMISSALSRLDCGQLGVIRFGESAELLHSFDQPFSATAGAHILQHLSFAQARTNFVELLRTAALLFSQSLERRSQSSPLTSQLLLVLSDGRGVFADGTTPIEVAIHRLNELGVLTVFVILDSLSKDSVLNIKVPSFLPGKAPVIRSYLETFPFSFYIVLQDIKSLPLVMGKALQQWFELLSGR